MKVDAPTNAGNLLSPSKERIVSEAEGNFNAPRTSVTCDFFIFIFF